MTPTAPSLSRRVSSGQVIRSDAEIADELYRRTGQRVSRKKAWFIGKRAERKIAKMLGAKQ